MGDPSAPSVAGRGGRWLARYGVAVLASVACLAVRLALTPLLHDRANFLLFVPAVMLAAAFGGFRAAALATAIDVGLNLWLAGPGVLREPQTQLAVITFVALGLGYGWAGSRMIASMRQASAALEDLEEREAHLASILATVPSAMIVPWSITMMRSASESASSRYCVVSKVAMPSALKSATSSQIASRLRGSSPVVGSSRNTTSGRTTRPHAMSMRRRIPPE